ncbi:MAG: DUF2807 domain-containing protein [Rikenellaceae bacterium]|nr:DUF2807 domain-containing protein [Rikenellaceae bacterium]
MKRFFLMMAAMLAFAGSLTAAQATKEFSRGLTTEVSIDGAFRVVMSEQYRNNIKIDFDDALANLITTEIKGKQLKIYYSRGANKVLKNNNLDLPTIYIDRNFASYQFKDAVVATAEEKIEGAALKIRLDDNSSLRARIAVGKLEMTLTDATTFEGEVNCQEAKIAMNGSSSMEVKGLALKLNLTAQGSSNFKGSALDNQSMAKVSVSGSAVVEFGGRGTVTIATSGTSSTTANVECKALNVKASGSSNVELSGSSKSLKIAASGASRIEQEKFQNDMSAKITASGTSNVDIYSRGTMKITASGSATIFVKCDSNITVKASNTAAVFHNTEAKLTKLTLKDQATVRAQEEEKPAVNVYASPYGNAAPRYMQR